MIRYQTWSGILKASAGGRPAPEEALRRMRHLYDRSARLADDWLAGVLERLDDRGLLDDTLVIVTSDHGENFGEGGLIGHVLSLDQRLLRVPLVTAGPGALAPEMVLSLASVPARIAEAVGLRDHPWAETPLGRVAVAQNEGFSQRPSARSLEEAQRTLSPGVLRALYRPLAAATDGRYKLVRTGDREVLHDLEHDPLEERDALAAQRRIAAGLRAALDAATPADAPVAFPGELADAEDAEVVAPLEALGYL